MFTYEITEDDYPIRQCKGKKQAIEKLNQYFGWEGIYPEKQKWSNFNGDIKVIVDKRVFRIKKLN